MSNKKPTAVVLGMTLAGLGVVRSLGREKIPLIGLASNVWEEGFSSRFCKEVLNFKLSNHELDSLNFLQNLGKRLEPKPALFPTGDVNLLLVSRNRRMLEKYFYLTLPSQDIVENIVDKRRFYNLALKYNFPVPKTYVPNNLSEVESLGKKIGYPCIIKPIYSHDREKRAVEGIFGYKKAVMVTSFSELMEKYSQISSVNSEMMIQEFIEGGDDQLYSFHTYLNAKSQPLAIFIGRKLRTFPPQFGMGCFVESVYEPVVTKIGVDLLQKIGYNGIAVINFKRDPNDGQFKILEINGRFSLWNSLDACCGVNLPLIAYRDILGEPIPKVTYYKTGVRWLSLEMDLKAFRGYKARHELSTYKWLKSLIGKNTYALFAWDDPLPFLHRIIYLMRILVKKCLRWILRK